MSPACILVFAAWCRDLAAEVVPQSLALPFATFGVAEHHSERSMGGGAMAMGLAVNVPELIRRVQRSSARFLSPARKNRRGSAH